jgi:hypothetical protein
MARLAALLGAIVASVTLSTSAQACRVPQPVESVIARIYVDRPALQVASVTITDARLLRSESIDQVKQHYASFAPWRATASVRKMLVGQSSPEFIVLDGGWGRADCNPNFKMPGRNGRWIIYYTSDSLGRANVHLSLPLRIAVEADPRVRPNGS